MGIEPGTQIGRDGRRYPIGALPAAPDTEQSLVRVRGTPAAGKSVVWDAARGIARWADADVAGLGRVEKPILSQYAGNPVLTRAASGLPSIYSPCVLRVDTLIPNPIDAYYMWYSTDHDPGGGGIGLATAPHPLGPWTAHPSNPIFVDTTAGFQTETPWVVWNEVTSQFFLYYQQAGAGAVGFQQTLLAKSGDGVSFTRTGIVIMEPALAEFPGDGHTGYAKVFRVGGLWVAYHLLGGTNFAHMGMSLAVDGEHFTIDPRPLGAAMEATGDDTRRVNWHSTNLLMRRGRVWWIGALQAFVSAGTTVSTPWRAAPLASDGRSFIGPMLDITPPAQPWVTGAMGGPSCVLVDNGTMYVYYRANGAQGAFGIAVSA